MGTAHKHVKRSFKITIEAPDQASIVELLTALGKISSGESEKKAFIYPNLPPPDL